MSNLQLQFQIECKDTKPGEEVYLVGNANELGNWNAKNSQKLKTSSNKFPLWESNPISFDSKSELEYKYIIKNSSNNVKWENFDGNRSINLSGLGNDFYIVNDGRFSNKSSQEINKSDGTPIQTQGQRSKSKKKIIKKKSNKNNNNNSNKNNNNHNSNNYQYINTNADEYVKSKREDIKNADVKLSYKGNANNVYKDIEQFINLLVQKNNEKKTWREKLATTCELINENYNKEQIISIIAAYLYFVNSGQIKCSEDGTHFRPNHSAQHAFNIFKRVYKQIFDNSEQINENSFSVVARSILRNLPSFNDQFMVSVPLTRIRDIAHRSDIPHDLKQEIKHKLQNKLHRNAAPDDLVVCEYFINKIKNANYSEAFKKEFYIFYDELKEFFNSNNLENLLYKFKDISGQNASQTQGVIDSLKNNDLVKRIETITNFRENVCSKIIKKEVESGDQIQKTLLQTTSNLDIELENKLFVIISEYIDKLTRNNSNKFENNYFKNLLNLFKLCLRNIEVSEIAKKQISNLKLDLEYFHKNVDNLNRFVMLQIKSLIERGNNISIEICSNLEHLFDLDNLVFLGNKLNINQRAVLVFVESFIRSNIIFQFSKCCDLLMTIIRDYLNLPPYNIINKGSVQGEFYYYENIDAYNQQNINEDGNKILLIENSDGTEEVPKNVVGIMLNQDLSQLSHISIRVRQHKAAFCCVLDPKIFKDYTSKFKNRDLVAFECMNESQISLYKIDRITKKKEKDESQINNQVNYNKDKNNKDGKKKKKIVKKIKKTKEKEEKEDKEDKDELIYSVKDKEVFKTGSKFEKIKTLYDISADSGLFTTPFALCIPSNVYEYFFNLFLNDNQGNLAHLEKTEIKNLESQSENFRNLFVNFIMHLYDEKHSIIMSILDKITSHFSSLSTNNNLLAIRSSSNLEDNSGQAGAGLFDSYLNVDLIYKSEVIKHIAKVWASVFNSRAIINRRNLNIDTKVAKMSVIIMQMTEPDFCYVIHTINPINGNNNEVYIELAIGLGETLAQSNQKGAPYRLIYNRKEGTVNVLNLSSYPYEMERKTSNIKMIEYRNEDLTKSEAFINEVGKRLGKIGIMIEENISKEKVGQDIEGNYMKKGGDNGNYYIVQTRPEIA